MPDAIAVTTCAERVPPSSRAESPAKSIIRLWATAPKKAKATKRGAEDFQFDSGKERRYGRVRNVAPVEVTSIGVGQQLIPVETVLAVNEGTQEDADDGDEQEDAHVTVDGRPPQLLGQSRSLFVLAPKLFEPQAQRPHTLVTSAVTLSHPVGPPGSRC